jgi:hypothetical protein
MSQRTRWLCSTCLVCISGTCALLVQRGSVAIAAKFRDQAWFVQLLWQCRLLSFSSTHRARCRSRMGAAGGG